MERRDFITAAVLLTSRLLLTRINPAFAQKSEDNLKATDSPAEAGEISNDVNIFDIFMSSILAERDNHRSKLNPEQVRGADRLLNARRVNFVLFGYGETHEPPTTEHAWIGSLSVLSYDLDKRAFQMVSIPHDTRAREAEIYLENRGHTITSRLE